MDVNQLKAGQDFNELKASYVIFLCRFDPFDRGDAVYRFSMFDEEKRLPLGDDSYTIILNSRAESVRTWNTGEGVNLIMTLEQEILIKEARARKEGYAEGHAEGLATGLDKALCILLKRDGREDEYEEAMKDLSTREILLREFGLLE